MKKLCVVKLFSFYGTSCNDYIRRVFHSFRDHYKIIVKVLCNVPKLFSHFFYTFNVIACVFVCL